MISPSTAAEFDRLGYALIPNALSPDLRASLRRAADELLGSNITLGRDRGADGKDGFRGCLALNPTAFLPLVDIPACCLSSSSCSAPTFTSCPAT